MERNVINLSKMQQDEVCLRASALKMACALALPLLCAAQFPQNYTITTIAGTGTAGFAGDGGSATSAQFSGPCNVLLDSSGNLYVSDSVNHRVRKFAPGGSISTVAGNGTAGYSGDGKAAGEAELTNPCGLALDSSGNLYIADYGNDVVRKVTGANISTVAGNNIQGFGGDTGPATSANLFHPTGVTVDSTGQIYIADSGNHCIRLVDKDGNIKTVAGTTVAGRSGDGGPATKATLNNPEAVLLDGAGNYYIADTLNGVIRLVTSDGNIKTVAGTSVNGFSGDGLATAAQLNYPKSIARDSAGNLFIADDLNNRIRVLTPDGNLWTIAGMGAPGNYGDNGLARLALLGYPSGVQVDSNGRVYFVDAGNNTIRLLTPGATGDPTLPVISGGGVISPTNFGASQTAAPGAWVEIYGKNLAISTRGWETNDFVGDRGPLSLDHVKVTVGGQQAFVSYVSSTQVNALLASTTPTGTQPLQVTTPNGASDPYSITVNMTSPQFLAPPAFKVNGKQYVAALFPDNVTFVAPAGAVSGATTRPAKAGDTVVLYGVGFGTVAPYVGAGEIAKQLASLTAPLEIQIGGVTAGVEYAGVAPGYVGLYQINVVVPNVPAGDAVPVTFSLGITKGTQTLYTAIQ